MKICIIGNSHCNALKHASDLAESPLKGNVTFVTAPGGQLRLDVTNTQIIPNSESNYLAYADGVTAPEILLSDYDAFAIVGMAMSALQAMRLYQQGFRVLQHYEKDRKLISRNAFKAALIGLTGQMGVFEIARQLRNRTNKPVLLVAQPVAVEKIRTLTSDLKQHTVIIDRWRPVFDNMALAHELDELFLESMVDETQSMGVKFLPQPSLTRDTFFTKNEYQLKTQNAFSSSSSKKADIEDLAHMNIDYGKVVLEQMISEIRAH